jgi:hypothetical protein
MTYCSPRTRCALCPGTAFTPALSLPATPPANAFTRKPEPDAAKHPLEVALCDACGHAQLMHIVDPDVLFKDYVYVSGTSPVFVEHFRQYAADVQSFAVMNPGDLVIDVGSNDGTLLKAFSPLVRRIGIEPARDIASSAVDAGVNTIQAFLSPALARDIVHFNGKAKLVTANNVFAHSADLLSFVESVREMLAPDGVFVLEVSYLGAVLDGLLFDTVYHEHASFHALAPLVKTLPSAGLRVVRAELVETHGGSLRCYAVPLALSLIHI